MKRFFMLCVFTFFSVWCLLAQDISGILDSTVNYTAGSGDTPAHSFGLEEYANIRLRIRTGEKASFFAAFNLIAAAGNSAGSVLASTAAAGTENYAAAMELERLYFRINGDYIDTEAGLLRMNFGYGQAWSPSDFLNPRNPLFPNARPRGVLGMNAAFFPADSLKIMGFAAGPKEPLESESGIIPGLSVDKHWDRASLQALYACETPLDASPNGIHRFGLSLKADVELGFTADALYTLNPGNAEDIEGLSVGAGFDYNFFGGDLYLLFEYLFSGYSSVSSLGHGGSWTNHHYLYGTALYRFNDFCNVSLSTVLCFDDWSFSPFATINYEIFQGVTLNLTARFLFDQKTFGGSKAGELGPVTIVENPDGSFSEKGAKVIINAGARLRF
ncbi:MAG: hypothetical protein FWG99_06435 [Treponema sp.]|nr:hypothetical protein [Treponema sp.]